MATICWLFLGFCFNCSACLADKIIMKKAFALFVLYLAFVSPFGCSPSIQTPQDYCDFSGVMQYKNGNYSYLKEKQVLYVDEYLFSFANEANSLLTESFGFEPFVIEHLETERVGFSNDISEVYIQSEISLWEDLKSKFEGGKYHAYCESSMNKKTGEIIESDIVFSPEIFFEPRDAIDRAERSARVGRQDLRRFQREVDRVDDPQLREHYQDFADRERDSLRDYNRELKNYREQIEKETLITMIHEMGHALGYDHTPDDPENVMFPVMGDNRGDLTGKQIRAIACSFRDFFRLQDY